MRSQFTAGQHVSNRAGRILQVLVSLLVAGLSGCTTIITDNSLPWERIPNLLQQKSMMRYLHSSEFPVCIKKNTAANPECRRVFRKGAGYQLNGRTSIQSISPNEPILTLTNTRVSGQGRGQCTSRIRREKSADFCARRCRCGCHRGIWCQPQRYHR